MINKLEVNPTPKGILYNLKEHNLIQNLLINTLLSKKNCHMEDIAMMLQTNLSKIERVLLGQEQLSDKESSDLVNFFYIAREH